MVSLPPNTTYDGVPCYVYIEDSAQREQFMSFPPAGIREGYHLAEYFTFGTMFLSQPMFAAYKGGDWDPITLPLTFIAVREGLTMTEDQALIELERKVRWFQSLAFPKYTSNSVFDVLLGGGQPEYSVAEEIENRGTEHIANVQKSATNSTGAAVGEVAAATRASSSLESLIGYGPPRVVIAFGTWWRLRGYITLIKVDWQGPWHPVSGRPYTAQIELTIKPLYHGFPSMASIQAQHLNATPTAARSTWESTTFPPPAPATVATPDLRRLGADAARASLCSLAGMTGPVTATGASATAQGLLGTASRAPMPGATVTPVQSASPWTDMDKNLDARETLATNAAMARKQAAMQATVLAYARQTGP